MRHFRLQFMAAIALTIGAIIGFSISDDAGHHTPWIMTGHSTPGDLTTQ